MYNDFTLQLKFGDNMMKKLLLYTFFLGMCLISLQSINAATITVHPGGSIQSAVNQAANGDTVIVYAKNKHPYTYKESVVINKKVKIISSGKVTIQSRNKGSSVFIVNQGGAGSSIKNFILSKSNYAILVRNAGNTFISGNKISASLVGVQYTGNIQYSNLIKNKITGTNKNYGNGISFQYGSCPYLTSNNYIYGNIIKNFLHGILFNAKSQSNRVIKNKIYNSGHHGAGIWATDDSSYMQIIGNTVTGAEDGIAVQKIGSGLANNYLISGNVVKSCKNGFWLSLSYSTISNNWAVSNLISGIDITGSYNQIINNIVKSNNVCGIAMSTVKSSDINTLSHNTLLGNAGNFYIVGPGKLLKS